MKEKFSLIVSEIDTALQKIDENQIEDLVQSILRADTVFLTGVGRVLLSLQAFSKRLTHLGIKAYFVGANNEPAFKPGDLLIVGSGSGCSIVPVAIAKKAKEFGGKVIHIGSNPHGDVSPYTDAMVRIPVQTRLYLKDEIVSQQPMTSLFEQSLLVFLDAVSMEIIQRKKLDLKQLWQWHANLE